MSTSLKNFTLSQSDFTFVGQGLTRPECVWTDHDGVWVSDNRGGVAKLGADGTPALLGHGIDEPNGFSRRANGAFVVASLTGGKLFEISPSGETRVLLDAIDGKPLGTVNHAWVDAQDRVWVSIMTRQDRWYGPLKNRTRDGYVVLIDHTGARIVTDGLDLTNEVKVSPDGQYLYVAETFARRILRFPILANGDLGAKEVFGPADLGHGGFPDGFTLDGEGNVWVTLVARNGISVITKDGELLTVYEEPNHAAIDQFVTALEAGTGTPEMLGACAGAFLTLPTSFAFGGEDGKTVFVGSLPMSRLATFRAPVAGRGIV